MTRSLLTLSLVLLIAGCQTSNNESPSRAGAGGAGSDAGARAGGGAGGGNEEVRRAVTEALDQYLAALLGKDIPALERLWADDLIFINPRGEQLTKAQRLSNVRSGATAFRAIDTLDQQVHPLGPDAAYVIDHANLKGQYSGQEGSGEYRVTTVWSRRGGAGGAGSAGGQWQIRVVHMTRMGGAAPATKIRGG